MSAATPRAVRALPKSLVDSRQPITRTLAEHFGGQLHVGTRGKALKGYGPARHQHDIVSEQLCDDTIGYLAPTLEEYKGCTIVDVHPGACVWSAKLHDHLQPQRHVLMEPEERYYDPFIKPLLDQPGSTYRHTPLTGAHFKNYWVNYTKIMNDPALIPPRPARAVDDPKLREPDTSLLLIGNLARTYRLIKRATSVRYSTMVIQHMAWAALSNSLIHTHGLVRMLWWCPETDGFVLFPFTEAHRQSTPLSVAMGAKLNQVVGVRTLQELGGEDHSRRRRRPELMDRYIAGQVAQSMRSKGMQLPKDRELLFQPAEPGKIKTEDILSPLIPTSRTISELEVEVDEAYARMDHVRRAGAGRARGARVSEGDNELLATMIFPQSGAVAELWLSTLKIRNSSFTILIDMNLRILKLEASFKTLEDEQQPQDLARLQGLRDRILALDERLSDFAGLRFRDSLAFIMDEQIACFRSQPLLSTEARDYEPFQAEDTAFWPRTGLMLLDMMPKPRDVSVPDLAGQREGARTCQMLVRHLFQARALTLPQALDRLALNAAQDLIPLVPAITDVRQGGRLNPKNVRVRVLSEEMVEGLAKAWFEWPFKPSSLEIELAAENAGAGDEDAEGAEGAEGAEAVEDAASATADQ